MNKINSDKIIERFSKEFPIRLDGGANWTIRGVKYMVIPENKAKQFIKTEFYNAMEEEFKRRLMEELRREVLNYFK